MPYLFDSLEHAWKVVDGLVGEELARKADAKGLVLIGIMDNGIRHTSNNKRPIEKPEDLKGLKIRTPPDPVTVSIFRALGADTQQIKAGKGAKAALPLAAVAHQMFLAASGRGEGNADDSQVIRSYHALNGTDRGEAVGSANE